MRKTLTSRYIDAIQNLPGDLRVRKPLEEKAFGILKDGKNICIRGFWRIGKTELMKASLERTCNDLQANGLFFELRHDREENPSPESVEEVRDMVTRNLKAFYRNLGIVGITIDRENPLQSLQEVDSQVYLGIDEIVSLSKLGKESMEYLLNEIKNTPENVRSVLVCHRNVAVDELFEDIIVRDGRFETLYIPPLTESEFEYIVQVPAYECGVRFQDSAVVELAKLSGNKPWEAFLFCFMMVDQLEKEGHIKPGAILGDQLIKDWITLRNVGCHPVANRIIENYIRIFLGAMNQKEREVMQLLSIGEGFQNDEYKGVIKSLEETGWIKNNGKLSINSSLFEELINGVTTGKIEIGMR